MSAQPPILVPVDFSDHSAAALDFAAELASHLKAPLVVLHVVHDPGGAPGYYAVKGRRKQLRRMEDVAAEMLDDFLAHAKKEKAGCRALKKAKTMLVVGLPVNRILEISKKLGARMVVLGSQGRTGLAHALLGSKSGQVVRLCEVPVTIVKAHKEGE